VRAQAASGKIQRPVSNQSVAGKTTKDKKDLAKDGTEQKFQSQSEQLMKEFTEFRKGPPFRAAPGQ